MTPVPGDHWRPTAIPDRLRLRARLLARVRGFFAARGVLEVETPLLGAAPATAPHLDSFETVDAGGRRLFLQTSPEYAMKRLLAAGSGDIFQVCHAFRAGERGRWHNPEFTLVEWYRVGMGYRALMEEAVALVETVLGDVLELGPFRALSYAEAFAAHAGIDPLAAGAQALARAAVRHGIGTPGLAPDDADGWRDLLMTHVVEPALPRGCVVGLYDYPASQAALARVRPGKPPVAERFELYLNGVELANGYQELTDADALRERFAADNAARRRLGRPALPPDEHLLAAMAAGLPECAGVALGFDRLVMLAAGAASIDEVLAFPVERA